MRGMMDGLQGPGAVSNHLRIRQYGVDIIVGHFDT